MTLTSYQALLDAINNGKFWRTPFVKSVTANTGQTPACFWKSSMYPGTGITAAIGAGTAPTKDTVGALYFENPTGGDGQYLLSFGVTTDSDSAMIMLADILVFTSGLSGTVTTAQTVNSTALTRYTSGEGVFLGLYCWTATGTTAVNVTTSYTNQDGTTGRSTPSVAFWTGGYSGGTLAPLANQIQFLPLQAGDRGVRAVASVTLSATTGTPGDFGVILLKPLAYVHVRRDGAYEKDFVIQTNSLVKIEDNACLCLVQVGNFGSTNDIAGRIVTVIG